RSSRVAGAVRGATGMNCSSVCATHDGFGANAHAWLFTEPVATNLTVSPRDNATVVLYDMFFQELRRAQATALDVALPSPGAYWVVAEPATDVCDSLCVDVATH